MADHFSRPLRLTRQRGARRLPARDRAGGDTGHPGRAGARGGAREAPRRARPGDARRGGPDRGREAGAAPAQLEAVRAAARGTRAPPARVRRASTGEWTRPRGRSRGGLLQLGQLVRRGVGRRRRRGASLPRRPDPARRRRGSFDPAGSRGPAAPFTRRPTATWRCGCGCSPAPGGSPSTTPRPRYGRDRRRASRSPCRPRGWDGSPGCCSGSALTRRSLEPAGAAAIECASWPRTTLARDSGDQPDYG